MDEVQLANYYAGLDPGPVAAGVVSDWRVARVLGCTQGAKIQLSDWTLTKTKFRHDDLDFADYLKLSEILREAFVIRGRTRETAEMIYVEPREFRPPCWRVVVKHTVRSEAFITNFQRYHFSEARRIYRRALKDGQLVLDAKSTLAQRLLRHASIS